MHLLLNLDVPEYIDLYLLHWPGSYALQETVEGFEALRAQGKIGAWGVSNFDVDDLLALDEPACATNQVLYNLQARGIEFDLLPWQAGAGMPLMGYCPLGQGGALLQEPVLRDIARQHGVSPAQVALAWALRSGNVIAIPKAVDERHLRENAAAAELRLGEEELRLIDGAFAPPRAKQSLQMI